MHILWLATVRFGDLDFSLLAADAGFRWMPYSDWAATLLWATSGAMLGARRGFDIPGILVVALVSATGGGLLRDGLFLQQGPPALLRTPIYLVLVGVAAVLAVVFGPVLARSAGSIPWWRSSTASAWALCGRRHEAGARRAAAGRQRDRGRHGQRRRRQRGLTFLIRFLALRLDLRSRPLRAFEEDWRE